MDGEPTENPNPRHHHKVLRSSLARKVGIFPEAMNDKMQACTNPKNMKNMQDFVGILVFWRTFIAHMTQCLYFFYYLRKKRHVCD